MTATQRTSPQLAWAVLLTALAGGMGWGIRGQYGHETGAMIAGVLVGFTLALLFLPHVTSLRAARAVALISIGVSIGGSMTYGQTIGLTQDVALVGNWAALRWGLLGLFIKGGLWIGFAGALLGMGMSDKRYRPGAVACVLLVLLVLYAVGVWLLNSPFDPGQRTLPRIYFSDDWYWEPGATLKPRPECWGGLLLAWVGLTGYLYAIRKDVLAGRLALIGFLAGGIGFAGGQCVQAFHAWNPAFFATGWLRQFVPHVNWWNMMEISFGAIWGGLLAAGVWLNRRRIAHDDPALAVVTMSPTWEFALAAIFALLVVAAEFASVGYFELYLEFGLVIALLPVMGILGGRYWPYLFPLPLVALPIAGKTLRELSYKSGDLATPLGWMLLLILPLVLLSGLAIWSAERGKTQQGAGTFARCGLLATTWVYFGLNLCFFRFPWPWCPWTGRTPSGIIFFVCTIALTWAAIWLPRQAAPGNVRAPVV